MLHSDRVWCVGPVDDDRDLAGKLAGETWCGCTGFALGEYLFLNDSTGPDGAQEWAVVKRGEPMRQVETITFGWCSFLRSLRLVTECLAGVFDNCEFAHDVAPKIETVDQHKRCGLCA